MKRSAPEEFVPGARERGASKSRRMDSAQAQTQIVDCLIRPGLNEVYTHENANFISADNVIIIGENEEYPWDPKCNRGLWVSDLLRFLKGNHADTRIFIYDHFRHKSLDDRRVDARFDDKEWFLLFKSITN
jgi:hypothetical protein